jgi:chromosome partitioning protein
MVTITLLNQKGGVGKTSTTHHLGGTLARTGLRVLLVDNDPQASLTQGFWGPQATSAVDPASSVAALYDPDRPAVPAALVRPTGFDGLSIVPGSDHLTPYNVPACDLWAGSQDGIRDGLGELDGEFDVCLVDCPPNLHLCSWAALVASDAVLVPLQAEDYGAQGIAAVSVAIRAAQASANPRLGLLGYLITMYDKRLGIHAGYETLLREGYGDDVFGHQFPLMKDFKEAVAARQPISHFRPKSAAAKAVRAIADEALARLAVLGAAVGPERRVA